MPVRASALDRD
jgi:hypothetical protein